MKCYFICVTLIKQKRKRKRREKKNEIIFFINTSNIYLGSSLSNLYLSDHELSSPTISMHPHYHQKYRSTNNNNRGESND